MVLIQQGALLSIRPIFGAAILAIMIAGCANLQTIDRHTDASPDARRAVHLDAQQRLVVFTTNRYCAEPSPDALSAYAAAIGVSGARLPNDSAAASIALNSAAASMGLRTQSITMIRDSLYRTCEAAANGDLTEAQVAVLLTKSQDLAVVVLAVEQLTGAVTAAPVAVGGTSSASASATLLANAQAVEVARKAEAEAQAARDEAKERESKLVDAFDDEKNRLDTLLGDDPKDDNAIADQKVVVGNAKHAKELATAVLEQREAAYQRAILTREAIEAQRDSTLLMTAASASGNYQLGSGSRGSNINEHTVEQIAGSVENMVTKLLDKSYQEETCLILLTNEGRAERARRDAETADQLDRAPGNAGQMAKREVASASVKAYQSVVEFCTQQLSKESSDGKGVRAPSLRGR